MKAFYARDASANEGKTIISFFAVAGKQVRPRRAGGEYVHLALVDRTGKIDGKLWDFLEQAAELKEDDIIKVQGRIGRYQGVAEISIERLRKAQDNEIDLSDFLPVTACDVEQLWSELVAFVGSVHATDIRQLLTLLIEDPEIATLLRRAPAAKAFHHAFLGGLVEHVVSLCRLCSKVHELYPWLNRDLLIATSLLHDIGKIYELSYLRNINYSDRGKLIGHISIGLQVLRAIAERVPNMGQETMDILEHLVLSHHGKLEYGSPVEPACAEAVLFHFLDHADSKLAAIKQMIDLPNALIWTERVPSLGKPVVRADAYLRKTTITAG
jgi:3'-5' exoribonuclease